MGSHHLPERESGTVTTVRMPSGPKGGAAQPAIRRLIVFTLLFVMVVVVAIGLSGLLGHLLDVGRALAASASVDLAQGLAFTLVGGSLAVVLWAVLWRKIGDEKERSSVGWGLYLAGMSAVSLITFATSLLITASSLVGGDWQPRTFSTGVVWAGVWAWHRWMLRHVDKSPTRLVTVSTVISSVFGLVIGVGGAVTALGTLLGAAIDGFAASVAVGDPWWRFTIEALVWAVGGAVVWWWHWIHDDARHLSTGFATVALVGVGVVGAVILTLGGVMTIVFVLLRLAFDRTEPTLQILDPLPWGIAAAAVGSLVWAYHRGIAIRQSDASRQATRLTTSGVGLVAAASGIGVIVNSLLATMGTPLVGSDTRTLLLGGISALAVGGPVWWVVWKPTVLVDPIRVGSTGRRIYLIAVFGLSAVVVLITLLVIGFLVFEFVLGGVTGQSLIDRVRGPLGLLVATGLVAGYHYSVWMRDRSAIAAAPTKPKTIGHVILVTGSDPEPLRQVIDDVTGAGVTVWLRSDVDVDGPNEDQLSHALEGVTGKRVMVITGPRAQVDVIPLKG